MKPMTARERGPVLLVDDDKDLLQLIAMRLTAAGYAVTRGRVGGGGAHRARGIASPGGGHRPAHGGHGRHGAVRRHPPRVALAAGGHPHRARHHSRGGDRDAARRVQLPHQAVRPQGAARTVAEAMRLSSGPAAKPRTGARDHHALPAWRSCCRRPAGRRLGRERVHLRRERHRQGAPRARDPPRQPRARGAVRGGELRRDPRGAARVGAVRPQEGPRSPARSPTAAACSRPRRAARCSSTRSATCRCRCRSSCCACSKSARSGRSARTRRSTSTCA